MTGICQGCGKKTVLEPFSSLCVDCLIAAAKHLTQLHEKPPFDPKQAAAGKDE